MSIANNEHCCNSVLYIYLVTSVFTMHFTKQISSCQFYGLYRVIPVLTPTPVYYDYCNEQRPKQL